MMHDAELEGFTREAAECLFEPILRILEDHPQGIREYDLLRELEQRETEVFSASFSDSELELFRSHFFLFHILYRLRDKLLRERRYRLEIFCLEIRLYPCADSAGEAAAFSAASPAANAAAGALDERDGVRDYYLNLENLYATDRTEVRRMLRDFSRRLKAFYRREDALQELGLGPAASFYEVKRRYRQLVLEHHPDRGGNPERFRRVRQAMEVLAALPW